MHPLTRVAHYHFSPCGNSNLGTLGLVPRESVRLYGHAFARQGRQGYSINRLIYRVVPESSGLRATTTRRVLGSNLRIPV